MESASLGSSPSIASRMVLPEGRIQPVHQVRHPAQSGVSPPGLLPKASSRLFSTTDTRCAISGENWPQTAPALDGSARNSAGSRISTSDAWLRLQVGQDQRDGLAGAPRQ